MRCRNCNSKNTRVTATEHHDKETWRYCRCLNCKHTYKTIEIYAKQKPGPVLGTKTGPKAKGSSNGASVLTEKDVIKLRNMAASGTRNSELSVIFGIAPATVSRIKTGKLWSHV